MTEHRYTHPATAPKASGPAELTYDDDMAEWVLTLRDGIGGAHSSVIPQSVVDQLASQARGPAKPEGIQAQVTVVEWANLGDSAAYVRRPLTYDPNETVGALLARAHRLDVKWHTGPQDGDRVELQIIPETVPTPTEAPF